MRRFTLLVFFVVVGLVVGLLPAAVATAATAAVTRPAAAAAPSSMAAEEKEYPVFLNTDDFQWQAAPPGLPPGAKVAVIYGNPHRPGPFVIRVNMPAGYKILPHWHTRAENLTILAGTVYFGGGDDFDYGQAHAVRVGGYHYLPAKMHHFAYTEVPSVIQIHGEGPFDIHYVRAADDPRNAR